MNKVINHVPGNRSMGHNVDSIMLVSVPGQVCAQDNWTAVVCKIAQKGAHPPLW